MSFWSFTKKIVLGAAGFVYPPISMIDTAVAAADAAGKISERHLYVTNKTSVPISIIVAPNKYWVVADIGGAIAQLVISLGSSAPSGIAGLKAAKSLYDVYEATRHLRSALGLATNFWNFFTKKGHLIEPGKYECVNKRSNSNPLDYLNPSQYGAVLNGSDIALYILTKDGRSILFNTNSDAAWIVTEEGIKRAKSGKREQPDDQPVRAWGS